MLLKVHIACTQMFVEMYGNENLIPHMTNEIPSLNLVVESHGECSNHML
jgi:hypothetical protein